MLKITQNNFFVCIYLGRHSSLKGLVYWIALCWVRDSWWKARLVLSTVSLVIVAWKLLDKCSHWSYLLQSIFWIFSSKSVFHWSIIYGLFDWRTLHVTSGRFRTWTILRSSGFVLGFSLVKCNETSLGTVSTTEVYSLWSIRNRRFLLLCFSAYMLFYWMWRIFFHEVLEQWYFYVGLKSELLLSRDLHLDLPIHHWKIDLIYSVNWHWVNFLVIFSTNHFDVTYCNIFFSQHNLGMR